MMAAQLFKAAERDIPDLKVKIAHGDFRPLKDWLRMNVHRYGSMYPSPDELMIAATGNKLDQNIFSDYIISKYSDLYEIK